jgi:hypothetical protein
MKVEINNENKAKFLDLYVGQESDNSSPTYSKISRSLNDMVSLGIGDYAVKLKPLSSISDEDKEIVTKYHNTNLVKINDFGGFEPWDDGDFILWNGNQIDYLRSKGYALPWMGLSVNKMVEAGWIKIISE